MILGGGRDRAVHGIFYPWVTDVVARELGAHVIEPEHRFYGASQPRRAAGAALAAAGAADAARLLDAAAGAELHGARRPAALPGVTFGGSYPGWLSAMMRARYPRSSTSRTPRPCSSLAQVDQAAYYARVTASAESARAGCSGAVRDGMLALQRWRARGRDGRARAVRVRAGLWPRTTRPSSRSCRWCSRTFAGLNMAGYPPGANALVDACDAVLGAATLLQGLADVLAGYGAASARGRRARVATVARARRAAAPRAPRVRRAGATI